MPCFFLLNKRLLPIHADLLEGILSVVQEALQEADIYEFRRTLSTCS